MFKVCLCLIALVGMAIVQPASALEVTRDRSQSMTMSCGPSETIVINEAEVYGPGGAYRTDLSSEFRSGPVCERHDSCGNRFFGCAGKPNCFVNLKYNFLKADRNGVPPTDALKKLSQLPDRRIKFRVQFTCVE